MTGCWSRDDTGLLDEYERVIDPVVTLRLYRIIASS